MQQEPILQMARRVNTLPVHEAVVGGEYEQSFEENGRIVAPSDPPRLQRLPPAAKEEMTRFLFEHRESPYMTHQQKEEISERFGIPVKSINIFMTNGRSRFLQRKTGRGGKRGSGFMGSITSQDFRPNNQQLQSPQIQTPPMFCNMELVPLPPKLQARGVNPYTMQIPQAPPPMGQETSSSIPL